MTLTDIRERHWGKAMMASAFMGILIAFSISTIISWDVDNEFPELHQHMTLVRWIKVNQIDHLKQMAHDIW